MTSRVSKDRSPNAKQTGVGINADRWLGATIVKLIEMAVADGSLKGHPYEVIDGGLMP